MTYEEALNYDINLTPIQARNDLERYLLRDEKPIYKAVAMGMQALEKQIPKKVYKNLKETYGIDMHPYHCPTCKSYISMRGYVKRDKIPINERYIYCFQCGQALDWSDTEND